MTNLVKENGDKNNKTDTAFFSLLQNFQPRLLLISQCKQVHQVLRFLPIKTLAKHNFVAGLKHKIGANHQG